VLISGEILASTPDPLLKCGGTSEIKKGPVQKLNRKKQGTLREKLWGGITKEQSNKNKKTLSAQLS